MSKFSKKIVSAALTATTATWMSGAMLLVAPVAHAQSAGDLQAQIAALLAQIQNLQSQLGQSTGGSMSSYTFTTDLTIGSKGMAVDELQKVLIAKGYLAIAAPTGYFGSLTQAAVAKWQSASGITPPAGYFGPKSRAVLNSMMVSNPTIPGGPVTTVPGSGLAASLAIGSPAGSAIAGAGQIEVGKFNLTAAANGGAVVTGVTFKKLGVVSDSNINNLYLADESGAVIAQYNSLSQNVATFSGLNLSVSGGQTRTLTLRMDLSTGATAGNTIAWALDTVSAGSVMASGLPVSSNTLTVTTVSNPSLSAVTFNFGSVGSSVDAGTTNVIIGSAAVGVSNSPAWLKALKYTLVGSASFADVRNLKLMVNGSQVGSTVSAPAADGSVTFNLSSAPVMVSTGNATFDLYADIMGSPNRNLTVRVLRPYDMYFVDSQYNTGVTVTLTDDSNAVTISQGQITVQVASDTPTGNVAKGASNTTLAKFAIYASGEPVKVKFLDVAIDQGSSGDDWDTVGNVTEDIDNIQIVDDAGLQVGSTISTVVGGATNGTCTLAADTITCHFGTSSSPINYIVPANTTRVLSVKVNVKSTNDAPSLKARLVAGSSNLEGQISFQTASSGAASGALLTVSNTPLTVGVNSAFGTQTYVPGGTNVKIASFLLAASSADGARVNSITIDKDSGTDALDLQNVKVMVGSTQFGTTRATVADGGVSMAFSGSSPITVPSGGSTQVDVYADVLTSSATSTGYSSVIDFTSWTAVGSTSNSSIDFTTAQDGQTIAVSSGPTVTLALDSSNAAAAQVVMGATGLSAMTFRLTNDNVEDVKITDLTFTDTISNGTTSRTTFKNMAVYDGSTLITGVLTPTSISSSSASVAFNLSTPLVVAKNSSKVLTLKGDTASFTDGGVSGSGHTWAVGSSAVTALGKDSNNSATVTGSASGNEHTVYRTKLTFTSALVGGSSHTRSAQDELATLTWTADSAYQAVVTTITLRFSGTAVSNGSTAFTVDLLKSDNTAFGGSSPTCTPGAGNSCSVTFNPSASVGTISAGTSISSKIRVNSSAFYDVTNNTENLSIQVVSAGDVMWNDGTTSNITLPASIVPHLVGASALNY